MTGRRRGLRGVGGFLVERTKTGSILARTPRQNSQTRCIESDKPCLLYEQTASDPLVPTRKRSYCYPNLTCCRREPIFKALRNQLYRFLTNSIFNFSRYLPKASKRLNCRRLCWDTDFDRWRDMACRRHRLRHSIASGMR